MDYDLFQLAAQPDVIEMLTSGEYATIKTDYDRISREHFDRSYFLPAEMRFALSDALFPPARIERALKAEYEAQCRILCYETYPSWEAVIAQFLKIRSSL